MNAVDVVCPVCGAIPNERCHLPDGTPRETHLRREREVELVMRDYMRSTFVGRDLPEAIIIAPDGEGDEIIVGPFCVHCGNPFSLHGPGLHCPNRILHPVFPGPACSCHGVAEKV